MEALEKEHTSIAERVEEIEKDVTERKQDRTPKTGKPSVIAERAKREELLQTVIGTLLEGYDQIMDVYAPELSHEETERVIYSKLGGRVAAEEIDLSDIENPDRFLLLSVIASFELPKLVLLAQRIQQEKKKERQRADEQAPESRDNSISGQEMQDPSKAAAPVETGDPFSGDNSITAEG